jgi:hypothetical protein
MNTQHNSMQNSITTLPHPILISILSMLIGLLVLEPFEILNIFLHTLTSVL